jgi:phosphonate transport system substrate-binding protein
MATEFVGDIPWRLRERLLDEGVIHVGWICGLPYVRRTDRPRSGMELLAAPVMRGARYAGRPVYFSDIVVLRDHAARTFHDLRGACWAYNEPGSHSGYNIVRYQLAQLGERENFFGMAVETGAHQDTLRMIVDGRVDASAIDSAVLETELRRRPALRKQLRVVETWGPSPAPPWVISRRAPAGLRKRLRQVMLGMHREAAGRSILREARMLRFGGVSDRDYDPIRHMARVAGDTTL